MVVECVMATESNCEIFGCVVKWSPLNEDFCFVVINNYCKIRGSNPQTSGAIYPRKRGISKTNSRCKIGTLKNWIELKDFRV